MGRERDDRRALRRQPASPVYTAEVVDDLADLDRVAAFFQAHPAHPASRFDLVCAGLPNSRNTTPFFVQVSRDGEPCLLMVGQLVRGWLRWRLGHRTARVWRARTIEVRRGGFLGDLSQPGLAFLRDYVNRLLQRGIADAIYVRDVAAGSALHELFGSCSHWLWRDRSATSSTNWQLQVPSSFAEWQAARPRRERKDTARYDKCLRQAFDDAVRVERVDGLADLDAAAEAVERIARTTYQRAMGTGFRDSAQLRARWRAAAAAGTLDLRLLWLGDQPVAFSSGFASGGTVWLEHLGYDPAFRRFRPGMYLLLRLIEALAARGDVHTLDFGIGDADYKRRLCDQRRETVSVYLFAPTLQGLWLNSLRALNTQLNRLGRACLGRLELLPWVKTHWRRTLESDPHTAP